MDDFQWEKRELPPLEPDGTAQPGRRRRNGSEEFTPEELAFLARFGGAEAAQRPVRERKPKARARLPNLQQPVQPQPMVQPQAPQRPRAAAPRRPASKFRALYTGATLKELKKATDRGSLVGIGKGIGDFEDVIKAAAKLAASGSADEAEACRALVQEISGYLTPERVQEYRAQKAKGTDDKGDKGDKITIKKHEAATQMLLEARRLQEDAVDRQHPQRHGDNEAARAAAMPGHAAAMAQTFGMSKASGGTSDVRLIRDSAGQVAYAFKSIDGESDQTGLPTGGAAVREAMGSFMAEAIRQQTRGLLDFGTPTALIATVNNELGQPKMGALVEGIVGKMADPEGIAKDYADGHQTAAELKAYQDAMKASCELSRRLPPRELNKVLLCNLAMANYDIKWGNMIVVEGDGGALTARPFDGGAAFPTDKFVAMKGLQDGEARPGAALLQEAISGLAIPQRLQAADLPMDPTLVKPFLAIDVDALELAMKAERDRLLQAHGLGADLLDDKAIDRSLTSIRAMQAILEDPDITMAGFVDAYNQVLAKIVA